MCIFRMYVLLKEKMAFIDNIEPRVFFLFFIYLDEIEIIKEVFNFCFFFAWQATRLVGRYQK